MSAKDLLRRYSITPMQRMASAVRRNSNGAQSDKDGPSAWSAWFETFAKGKTRLEEQAKSKETAGDYEGAARIWKSLCGRFPRVPEYQDALIGACTQLTDLDAARAHIRTVTPSSPSLAAAYADLLTKEQKLDEALSHLEAAVGEFGLKRRIVAPFDNALLSAGRYQDAERLFKDLPHGKPADLRLLGEMAENATAQKAYGIAAQRWKRLVSLLPERQLHHTQYIKNLLHELETDAAERHFETQTANFDSPNFQILRVEIYERQLRFGEALMALEDVMRRFGDKPPYKIRQAQLLSDNGQFESAEELLLELNRKNPDNAIIHSLLAKTALEARQDELARTRSRELCERWPGKSQHHALYINSLLTIPDIDAAWAHFNEVAPRLNKPEFSLNTAVRIYLASHDSEGAIDQLNALISANPPGRAPAYKRAELLMRKANLLERRYKNTGHKSALTEAREVLDDVRVLQSHNVRTLMRYSRALLAEERVSEAMALVDQLPETRHPDVMKLQAWRADMTGDLESAKEITKKSTEIHYIPQIKPCGPNVYKRIDENPVPASGNEIRLYSAIRNERHRLPWFLKYYRDLGVDRFFFMDNDSSDGSAEYLLKQADVHLFHTRQSYAVAYCGMRWINELVRTYGQSGWTIYADVDEALVFPRIESNTLRSLTNYMERHDHEALPAFMLDMYSVEETGQTEDEELDFIASYPLFENVFYRHKTINSPYYYCAGGARRVFGWGETLTKTPLVRAGRDIQFLMSSHAITPARLTDVNATLLHFKMTGDFQKASIDDLSNNTRPTICRLRHLNYQRFFENENKLIDLLSDRSTRYSGSEQLMELGLISGSDRFLASLNKTAAAE